MKRFLSIVAVAVLILALAAPAFAVDAVPSVTYEGVNVDKDTVEAETGSGRHVEVRNANPEEVNEENLLNAVEASNKVEEVQAIEVVDIVLVNSSTGEVVDQDTAIKVAFIYDNASDVAAVMIQNDNGTWSDVSFTVSGDKITLSLPHLTPVALVLGKTKAAPDTKPDDSANTNTNTNGASTAAKPGKSPQTGYNTVLWILATVAMAVCAGYCFLGARKQVAA